MKYSLISAADLGPAERRRWSELQAANGRLGSPCFSWQFTLAAAAARDDVRVVVLEEHHDIVGFFPFQTRRGAGEPAGGRLSDHHGVIAASGTSWNWNELLRGARLSYWQFGDLPASQRPPGVEVVEGASPGLDLSRGFEEWARRRRAASTLLPKLVRSRRKLEQEVGPLRLELHSRDPAVFETVIRLKREQCLRTAQLDFFAWPWTRAMVEHLRDVDDPECGGRVSALYAGDTLVAAHFGIRSARTWQWWFPVYSHAHGKYSPGSLLLFDVAQAAAAQGHVLLDLGKGDEPYKLRFADWSSPLVDGCVSRPTLETAARQMRNAARAWLRTSPLAQPLRPLIQGIRRMGQAFGAGAVPVWVAWCELDPRVAFMV